MKLYCSKCKKYLGVIRDGTLRKDIVHLCKECDTQRQALELMYEDAPKSSSNDVFNEFFGIMK